MEAMKVRMRGWLPVTSITWLEVRKHTREQDRGKLNLQQAHSQNNTTNKLMRTRPW